MTCHTATTTTTISKSKATKRVALIGMPNTGKSTFFNRITGVSAHVGNWPGVTVDLLQANVKINGETTEFVDLPGIYNFNGFSEDEKVVQTFLENYAIDLVLVIINAAQIDRQIRLPLQIKALGLPAVLMLNMSDEAKQYGIKIDTEELSKRLEMPVFLISAKYGKGYMNAYMAISEELKNVENSVKLNNLTSWIEAQEDISLSDIDTVLNGAVLMPSQMAQNFTAQVDKILLHPVWGLPLFFLGMFLVFWAVWNIGLPSIDLLEIVVEWVQSSIVEPLAQLFPEIVQDFLINGVWAGVTTVASFVPLIIVFFIIMAVLEDSGYLSRSAYLIDAFMAKLGLDGRSFVLHIMGFGCNVPALMGTRVMRSPALRLLTMLIIPFGLCSARLQVFVFIIAAVFPNGNGAIVLFSLYILSFLVAIITAALFQGVYKNEEPFILELPPYRLPTLKQVLLRSWGEVREFLVRASGFITVGCIAVWVLTSLPPGATGLDTIGGKIGQFMSPIMDPIGINPYLTLSLFFGFIAKEIVIGSLAVIYSMSEQNVSSNIAETVTFIQGYSFCIFCLLYTPCLSTLATIVKEAKSWKFSLLSLVFPLVLAWVSSFIFYQGALALGF
ncbi:MULTISPECIES: ferrous iron transport protein B [unclassified Okeania]|uniref:ferrous iron transport protein B n=1 Tax=unclassified Okeania TaxID=2634635 RepID=UPI0013B63E59|nr:MULTISPECIES: ferrous iron transport protein B [unclassified Okeania]NES76556.1 ferrous iron transport protein B [Okeania sp. SIO1H4]NET20254.1 ferrous iron transport protein B [Okeania sp. SIO1H5]NET96409.1 ferrous iron transport protein B [Okeania sp. SIO1H2]